MQHFLETASARQGREPRPIDRAALDALCEYDWPGNVRELRNVVERALVMSRGDVIVLPSASLRGKERPPAAAPDPRPLAERLRDFKRERIREALDHAGQSQTRAAERLGLHRQSLSRMMRELGLRPADPERVSGP